MDRLPPRGRVRVAGRAGTAIIGLGTLSLALDALRVDAAIVGVGGGELLVEEGEEVVVGELGELGGGLSDVPHRGKGRVVHGRLLT